MSDNLVHYKDCSRYNWHDSNAQCDGARCHPSSDQPPQHAEDVAVWRSLSVWVKVTEADEEALTAAIGEAVESRGTHWTGVISSMPVPELNDGSGA